MSGEAPGHDQRTCPECQAMIKHGGYRIIDLLGHAAFTTYWAQPVILGSWDMTREAWAQVALAVSGEWTACDTFEDWMESKGHPGEDIYAEYGRDDLFEAFMAGAEVAAREPLPELAALRQLVWDMLQTMGPSREALAFAIRSGQLGVTDEQGHPLVMACADAAQQPEAAPE